MDPKMSTAIDRYRVVTKGLKGEELQQVIQDFRCGEYTQDLYPTHTRNEKEPR